MTMTVQEIAKSYKEAADQGAQIGILADLNDCSKEQIVTVLKGQGITEIPEPKAKCGRKAGGHNKPKVCQLKYKPKDSPINTLIMEGIKALDEEINTLQEQLDIYKKKKQLLTQALELEERHGK